MFCLYVWAVCGAWVACAALSTPPNLLLLLKSSKVARGTERGSLPQTAYFLVPS